MNKKMNTLIIVFLFVFGLKGKLTAQAYDFNVLTDVYSDLTESTSLTKGMTWEDLELTIPIGFDFQYFDTTLTHLFMLEGYLGGVLLSDSIERGFVYILTPYGAQIVDRGYDLSVGVSSGGLSDISYKLEGNIGSRILKVEWRNVGFYWELVDDNVSTDFTNFQLWLYEGSNTIEMHYGPNSITQPNLSFEDAEGTIVALVPKYDVINDKIVEQNGLVLMGDPTAPVLRQISDLAFISNLEGVIPNGTTYQFSLQTTANSEPKLLPLKISMYPNPTKDFINIDYKEGKPINSIQILNSSGQVISQIIDANGTIDVSDLNSGIYIIQFTTESGRIVNQKIVKN